MLEMRTPAPPRGGPGGPCRPRPRRAAWPRSRSGEGASAYSLAGVLARSRLKGGAVYRRRRRPRYCRKCDGPPKPGSVRRGRYSVHCAAVVPALSVQQRRACRRWPRGEAGAAALAPNASHAVAAAAAAQQLAAAGDRLLCKPAAGN